MRATGQWQDWIINFQARQTAAPYREQLARQRLSYTCHVLGPTRLMNLLQPTSSGSFGRIWSHPALLREAVTPRLVATVAALVTILSCSLPVYSVPDWARDRAVIHTLVVDKMSEAWNTGDAALWAMAYLPDSEFMNIFGALYLDRWANRQRHADLFATVFQGSTLRQELRSLKFITDNVAIADLDQTLTNYKALPPWLKTAITTSASGPTPPLHTRMKHVLVRQSDNSWKIIATQNTSVTPLLQANELETTP